MEEIWNNIVQLQGQTFYTIRRKAFTYTIQGDSLQVVGNANYNLARTNFLRAFEEGPVDGPGSYPRKIVGPSYVWALLNDSRINK